MVSVGRPRGAEPVRGEPSIPKSHQTKGRERRTSASQLPSEFRDFFFKKELRRGWREARGRIIRMRDSKFGLCYKKVAAEGAHPGFI